MSENQDKARVRGEFDPILKKITVDDVLEFLDSANGTARCWFCGQDSLHPLYAQEPDPDTGELRSPQNKPAFISMPVQSDMEGGFEVRSPGFVISCSNCGFSFNISAIPLMQWKRDQGHDD